MIQRNTNMANKKTAKKATKKVADPRTVSLSIPFNKANAKLFADLIYSDKGGRVSVLKLCEGDLSDGKDGGRTLHCALGEAYFTFVGTDVKRFMNKVSEKYGSDTKFSFTDEKGVERVDDGCYQPKYFDKLPEVTHSATLAVVDVLVDTAKLRNNKLETKKKLAQALLDTMHSNDNVCGFFIGDVVERAKDVADTWRLDVIPLLK